jgi:methyl-accepting chemotaxis protein
VAEAGQTMSEIVGSVQRVSDIIGEITAASGEQRDGIAQVNTAVNQLDQMTQQNAALVEESAAAAESLRDQAARLTQVVQVFRLGGSFQVQLPAPATKHTPALASPAPSKRVASAPAAKAVAHAAAKPAPALELKRPQATAAPAKAAPKAVDSHKVVAKAAGGDEGDWESF